MYENSWTTNCASAVQGIACPEVSTWAMYYEVQYSQFLILFLNFIYVFNTQCFPTMYNFTRDLAIESWENFSYFYLLVLCLVTCLVVVFQRPIWHFHYNQPVLNGPLTKAIVFYLTECVLGYFNTISRISRWLVFYAFYFKNLCLWLELNCKRNRILLYTKKTFLKKHGIAFTFTKSFMFQTLSYLLILYLLTFLLTLHLSQIEYIFITISTWNMLMWSWGIC